MLGVLQSFARKLEGFQEGKYVRAYGLYKSSLEGQATPAHIFAFDVRPVEDHNEVRYHDFITSSFFLYLPVLLF